MLIFRAWATCGSMIFVVKESLPVKGSLSATQNAKSPQSAEEVRSFSDLVQYCTGCRTALRMLTGKDQQFMWVDAKNHGLVCNMTRLFFNYSESNDDCHRSNSSEIVLKNRFVKRHMGIEVSAFQIDGRLFLHRSC